MPLDKKNKFQKMKTILYKLFPGWYILLLLAIACYMFLILVVVLT